MAPRNRGVALFVVAALALLLVPGSRASTEKCDPLGSVCVRTLTVSSGGSDCSAASSAQFALLEIDADVPGGFTFDVFASNACARSPAFGGSGVDELGTSAVLTGPAGDASADAYWVHAFGGGQGVCTSFVRIDGDITGPASRPLPLCMLAGNPPFIFSLLP